MSLQKAITQHQSPLGLGLAALGRPGYITLSHSHDLNGTSIEAMQAHAHSVLDAAWEAGVRYFDAARSYGRAEAFLGSWLRTRMIEPNEVVIGSKWGYTYTADWRIDLTKGEKHEVKEHSLPVLERQIEETRIELADYLDLYQIHSATLDSGVLENQPVLAKLAELRNNGLTIGLSVSGPEQSATIERALTIEFDGQLLFGSVQATWNLLEQSAGPALQSAHDAGLMIIVKEAVANGRLTTSNNAPEFAPQMVRLSEAAQAHNTTVDGLAIAAALTQPWATIVLSGASRAEHLLSNLGANQVVWSRETGERLKKIQEHPDKYWNTRSTLAWN